MRWFLAALALLVAYVVARRSATTVTSDLDPFRWEKGDDLLISWTT